MYKQITFKLLLITSFLFLDGLYINAQDATAEKKTNISGKSLFGSLRARQIGPAVTSGRVSTLDVVESAPETMYIGAGGGGVWKSVTAGAQMRPVFDDYTQSIGKIKIDQNHPDTVWVGTGEPWVRNSVSVGTGIYKTTDGGGSWEFKGLPNSERIGDIIIHPKNPNTVYVAVLGQMWSSNPERGIYKTTDGGDSWEKVFYIDENTGCSDLDIDPENPDVLYATMWSYRRYPWSFDSGFTGTSGVYKTTNAGAKWKKIHKGLPTDTLGRMALAVAPSNGNTIYLSVEAKDKDDKGLYLSKDAGKSWERVSTDRNVTMRPFYFSEMIVNPKDENKIYKCGLNLTISDDAGDRFRTANSAIHSDIHAVWVDPNNTKHVIIGTDGGVYESYDDGYTFKMYMNLPISQFYRISVDMDEPYNVYGGLQDNGSWYAPSSKSGGIGNADWQATFGGDGFYSFRHPTDENTIFSEYQGGNLVRYNKKTGRAKEIQPYPENAEDKYRFNWNTPIHLSPNNTDKMYFAAQFLFVSEDKGDSWKTISPDLTTNDPKKQEQHKSGGLSIDNSTAENHCTIYAVAESYKNENVIWVGTDDGNLQVTKDGGKNWTNVVENVPDLPKNTWVTAIEPGHSNDQTAFVTFDGHRTGDKKTYVYKTTDLGKTWTNLATENINGYALSFRQDLVNENLLFLGTEFGLYVSIDGGETWSRFTNNLPKVGVRDMVIHPRDHALVMGTHGRGAIIIDDITPLRQATEEVFAKKIHFFDVKPNILSDPGAGGGWFGGAGNFRAGNPNSDAKIIYYMNKRHTFGKMFIEVYNDKDELIRTLPAGKSKGINIVNMPTQLERPKVPPSGNPQALFGSIFGPNFLAGKYKAKIIKGKEEYETTFELKYDPKSPYTKEGRAVQSEATLKIYNMLEQLAYIHNSLTEVKDQAEAMENEDIKELKTIAEKAEKTADSFVGMGGDFYVDTEEKLGELVSTLYRQVSSYPGRPSNSQLKRLESLERSISKVEGQYKEIIEKDLLSVNELLETKSLSKITFMTKEEFLKDR